MEPDVLILGAGVAGLSAAEALSDAGVPFLLLEASSHFGGRVRALEEFADFPIELGAEEIHGPDNAVQTLARRCGVKPLRHFTTDDLIRLDGDLHFLDQAENDPDLHRAFEVITGLGNYAGENLSVDEYLNRQHFPRRTRHYLDSRLGVEHGTTLDRLAMRGFLSYERGWEARETNYTLPSPYLGLFQDAIAQAAPSTLLGCPVESISWLEKPSVRCADGRTFSAQAVIVTASVAVLRENGIHFDPELPPAKRASAAAIGMDTGMKIVLKFRQRFWDERMYFLHADGFLPQFWVPGKGKSETSTVLTAFVGGARAEMLGRWKVDPVQFALGELDEIFGARIASRSFEQGLVADWGADPYVRGLYSYPTVDTTDQDRHVLAAALDNKVFFAGEATDTDGHSGTVHGAMATGVRAAWEVLRVLRG